MKRFLLIFLLIVSLVQARFGDEFDYSEYYTPDEVDALLALYLKLDTSNDPLTNKLESSKAQGGGFTATGPSGSFRMFWSEAGTAGVLSSDGRLALTAGAGRDLELQAGSGAGTEIVIFNNVNMNSNSFTTVVGGITPTASDHLVIKEYVDTAVAGLHFDMFLDDLDSTINDPVTTNDYYSLQTTQTDEGTTTRDAYATLGQGDDQEVVSYISGANLPFAELQAGLVELHIHARKNNTGQKDSIIFAKLYHRADGGTETLIATTEDSAELTNSVTEYNLHANIGSVVSFSSTDRLLLKIRADVQAAGGGNAEIEITQEGLEASRVSALVRTDTLSEIFVRRDGSKELTANWNVGNFDIKAQTFSIGSGTINETELTFLDGAIAGIAVANKASILGISKQTDTVIASTELISSDINVEIDPTPVTVDQDPDFYWRFKGDLTDELEGTSITLGGDGSESEQYTAGPPQMALFNTHTFYRALNAVWQPDAGGFSWSLLMRFTADATTQLLINVGDNSTSNYFFVRMQNTNKLRIQAVGGGVNKNGNTVFVVNQLYHIVVTVPSDRAFNNVDVYIDGVAETWAAGSSGTMLLAGTDLMIGARNNVASPSNYWTGDISDVAIYPKELNAAEALALYNGQKLATNFGGDINATGSITGASLHAADGKTLTINLGEEEYFFVDGILTGSN